MTSKERAVQKEKALRNHWGTWIYRGLINKQQPAKKI